MHQLKSFKINVYLIVSMCFVCANSSQYNNKNDNNANIAIGTVTDNTNTKETIWQPMLQNNWIILKKAAENDAAILPTYKHKHRSSSNNNANTNNRNTYSSQPNTQTNAAETSYQYWRKEQQANPVQLPFSYYTYNESSSGKSNTGNYEKPTTAADVKLIEPYFVTISKMRSRPNTNTDAILTTRRFPQNFIAGSNDASVVSPYAGAIKLPKDVVSSAVATPQIELRQDIKKYGSNNNKTRDNSVEKTMTTKITSMLDDSNANGANIRRNNNDNIIDDIKTDDVQQNEIWLPLQRTLDKVIYFCDMAKRFITEQDGDGDGDGDGIDEDSTDDGGNDDNRNSGNELYNILNKVAEITKTPTTEVQGHHSLLTNALTIHAQSRAAATLNSIGTGRKKKHFKKKLGKFILPLLIAYKLKFLTLIPVLIGGLTLLVGTTGLAGFFFALFTAVMSLKSTGSSKSIIFKKL